jgi:hypothetical protein
MAALSLNNICYRQIKDSFYYGIFGEFQLVIDQSTGCFNATKLCNIGGKNFSNWKRLEHTKQLIRYFESKSCPSYVRGNFYEIRESNNDSVMKQITGQYVQKELILDIASWISPEFYDKCNNIIINYFLNHYQNMTSDEKQEQIENLEARMKRLLVDNENKDNVIQEKNDKIDELMIKLDEDRKQREEDRKRMEAQREEDRALIVRQEQLLRQLNINLDDVACQNNELLEKVDDQNEKLDSIQHKLDIAVQDRAPQPHKSPKRERFILLKRNDDYYPYYTIRAQDISARASIRKQKTLYQSVDILLDLPFHPNSKTLFVRIKDRLKKMGVVFNLCSISIENSALSEQEFVDTLKEINNEKYQLEE